jgi:hypothetical protein
MLIAIEFNSSSTVRVTAPAPGGVYITRMALTGRAIDSAEKTSDPARSVTSTEQSPSEM